MRIVMYGNFLVDYCTEVHHAKTLESMGYQVLRMQETTTRTETVLMESMRSDMLVWIHSHGFKNIGRFQMDEVLRRLKGAGIPTVAYHLDLYLGLQRWRDYEHSPYMQVEHFFTVDKLMADWFNENTEVKGHYLPAGVFDQEAYINQAPTQNANDVIFVGSRGYHPEWDYRPKLVDWLRSTYGSRFTHVGPDGDTGVVRGDALNRIYANSKVAVGDTLCLNFDYPYYWSDRLTETLGRGGFLIHPRIKGLDEYYDDRVHLVMYDYDDFDQLKELIDHYCESDGEREQIRRAGHEHVKANHTYKQRWEAIIKELGL